MNSQEQPMNTQTQKAGYIVDACNPLDPASATRRTFMDPDLLTARQAAVQHAQRLVAKKQPHHALDIRIELVEFERTVIPNRETPIATVFSERFHRTAMPFDPKAKRINVRVENGSEEVAASSELTLDPLKTDESYSMPEALWHRLGNLTCEREYYESYGHSMGFGALHLQVSEPQPNLPLLKKLVSLPAVEVEDRLTAIADQTSYPFRSAWILYDSLSYAASMIAQYNRYYGDTYGSLSFKTDYVDQ